MRRTAPLLASLTAVLALAVALGALCAFAAPAGAAQFAGAVDDAAEPGLPGGQDVVKVEGSYDDAAGSVSLRVTFRGAPSEPDALATWFGTRDAAGTCTWPAVIFSGATGSAAPPVTWRRFDAAGAQVDDGDDGTRTQEGAVVTYTVAAPSLAAQGFDCVDSVQLVDGDGTDVETVVGFPLTAVASAPPNTGPPGSTGTPRGTTSPRAPGSGVLAPGRAGAGRKALLRLRVTGSPTRTAARGRWTTVTVRVSNAGTAAVRSAKLLVRPAHGVTVRLPRAARRHPRVHSLSTLKAGSTSAVRIRLRATRAGKVTFVAAGAGGLVARATITLKVAGKK